MSFLIGLRQVRHTVMQTAIEPMQDVKQPKFKQELDLLAPPKPIVATIFAARFSGETTEAPLPGILQRPALATTTTTTSPEQGNYNSKSTNNKLPERRSLTATVVTCILFWE